VVVRDGLRTLLEAQPGIEVLGDAVDHLSQPDERCTSRSLVPDPHSSSGS